MKSSAFQTFLILVGFFLLLSSCAKDKTLTVKRYIHVSHTQTQDDPNLDSKINSINFDYYDMTWLGGDIGEFTSQSSITMDAMNLVFDFGSPSTLWALGNHDYTNTALVSSYTNRPTYYAYHSDGITFLVLDTQLSDCSFIGDQKALIENVTDTLNASSHLIVLHHKLIWMPDDPVLHSQIPDVSNGDIGTCPWCLFSNNFYADIYPLFVNVKNRGIDVLCIGGDIGLKTKEFEYQTPEGIHFLASGLSVSSAEDKVLTFEHVVENRTLAWTYE